MNKENKQRLGVLIVALLIAAIARLLPHPPNFTPIAAMALFGGAYFANKKMAFIIPLLCMLFSDFLLQIGFWLGFRSFPGFHTTMIAVYVAFALVVGLGVLLMQQGNGKLKMGNLFGMTLAGSVVFFIITNFAVWIGSGYYPQNWMGLVTCFEAAIPFFGNTLIGDLCYSVVLFGGFELAKQKYAFLRVAS
ncbi:MAG: DUF6580 family putative transport protein [Chitinophagales bacterium]